MIATTQQPITVFKASNPEARLHRRAIAVSLLAIALLTVLLMTPGHPGHFTFERLPDWPLDVPLLVGVLLLLSGRPFALARVLITASVLLLLLLRLCDLISRTAFGRAFNPLAEWHLIQQGWGLTADTLGRFEALLLATAGLLILLLISYCLFRGLGQLAWLNRRWRTLGLLVCSLPLLLAVSATPTEHGGMVRWMLADELVERVRHARSSIADQQLFSVQLQQDDIASRSPTFAALAGRDVVFLYVESYGRSFVDNEQFRQMARQRLQAVQSQTAEAGLHVRSAWVDSPIRGGRSWLAHATVASGLRLTDHARFDRLISSERKPLSVLFGEAGWTTSVVLPVVKSLWVEGAWYQVDRFVDRDALDYQGEDFGYVTMPDQYTLTRFEERIRGTADAPLMAHIGLLDSHAPWGPLPRHQDWSMIGDGSVFDGSQRHGDRYSWARPEPVRKAYGLAVEQNLKLVGEYLSRFAADGLFIVLGDHQPASVIAGWAPNAHVPMHVFASDPALLERLPERFFSNGMLPLADAEALPMESIREMMATAFEAEAPSPASATLPETARVVASPGLK